MGHPNWLVWACIIVFAAIVAGAAIGIAGGWNQEPMLPRGPLTTP